MYRRGREAQQLSEAEVPKTPYGSGRLARSRTGSTDVQSYSGLGGGPPLVDDLRLSSMSKNPSIFRRSPRSSSVPINFARVDCWYPSKSKNVTPPADCR